MDVRIIGDVDQKFGQLLFTDEIVEDRDDGREIESLWILEEELDLEFLCLVGLSHVLPHSAAATL